MKEIQLTRGYVALVDDEDFPELSKYKWHIKIGKHTNYAYRSEMRRGVRKAIMMHRQILGITDRNICVDHINDDGLCNARSNLRKCTYSQNQCNKRTFIGTSKYKGIFYEKVRKKWRCQISFDNKTVYVGRYNTENEAALAFNVVAKEKFGEFARLNIVD